MTTPVPADDDDAAWEMAFAEALVDEHQQEIDGAASEPDLDDSEELPATGTDGGDFD